MATILSKISIRRYYSFYKVPYRSIMNFTIELESTQEQQVTTLVKNYNQQQIYISIIKFILLLSGRVDYTDWELRQSVEGRILLNSIYTAIHDNLGVPKNTLKSYMNVIFLTLKCSLLKHLCYLMSLGKINNKSSRNTISENIVKQKLGQ